MKHYMPWSDQEIEILTHMTQKGISAKNMASILKSRTIAAVQNKIADLGLEICKSPEIDLDAYAKLMKGEPQCL